MHPPDAEALRRRAGLLWGVALLALLFLLETWNADRVRPNPASPYVWSFLGLVGALAVAGALHAGRAARRAAAPPAAGSPATASDVASQPPDSDPPK